MAKPNKKRGFRPITVDNQKFQWRFDGLVDVRPEGRKNNRLLVDFGWYDKLLFVNGRKNEPPGFEPEVVTPEFVRQSISFALANGWDAALEQGNFEIEYKNEVYRCK
jgi:hypothetical protein